MRPEQYRARVAMHKALRNGKLVRSDSCQGCGKKQTHRALDGHHHNGYDDPLDVQWLCQGCHNAIHGGPLHRGLKHTEEVVIKIGNSLKEAYATGKRQRPQLKGEANHFFGRQHTEETKQKLRKPKPDTVCSDCGRSVSVMWLKRHQESGCVVASQR